MPTLAETLKAKFYARLATPAQKTKNITVQFVSAAVFLLCGLHLFLKESQVLGAMFLAEALGQFLLALDNHKSPRPDYQYFLPTKGAFWAMVSFMLVNAGRVALAYQVGVSLPIILAFVIFYLLFYVISVWKKTPREEIVLGLVLASSTFLGVSAVAYHDPLLASNQLGYSFLFVVAFLMLEAWVSEAINILLWVSLWWFSF